MGWGALCESCPHACARAARRRADALVFAKCENCTPGEEPPADKPEEIRGPANLAGAWSAQLVPPSPRPPRAAHTQAGPPTARPGVSTRTTPGCTCGHGSGPPTAPRGVHLQLYGPTVRTSHSTSTLSHVFCPPNLNDFRRALPAKLFRSDPHLRRAPARG